MAFTGSRTDGVPNVRALNERFWRMSRALNRALAGPGNGGSGCGACRLTARSIGWPQRRSCCFRSRAR